uniref:Uncharacterized protein n=1 Tax=Rhizophora mucronata TaxID=61149 RepID=A0A2P2Q7K6_RHIMU
MVVYGKRKLAPSLRRNCACKRPTLYYKQHSPVPVFYQTMPKFPSLPRIYQHNQSRLNSLRL